MTKAFLLDFLKNVLEELILENALAEIMRVINTALGLRFQFDLLNLLLK